jgi:hypothetical protein
VLSFFNLKIYKLSKKQIDQHEHREHYACNSIGCCKSKVYFTEVIWLHQCMLINEHADKNDGTDPVPGIEMRIKARVDHKRSTDYMQYIG